MALSNLICKAPRSFGKVKRAVDVFGDICQASLLHLTKAAVSFLNSFSGQIITGPKKARRGPRVQSIIRRPFSIERSLFLRRKQAISGGFRAFWLLINIFHISHLCDSVHYVSSLGSAIQPHVISNAQKSNGRFAMVYLMPAGFHACLHSRQGGFRWSCVGKWQFHFFLFQMGHCLCIVARFIRQASCPLML